jgi:hypothetical protein
VPALQQPVLVVGYPVGGDNVSVTKGVVSRVEPTNVRRRRRRRRRRRGTLI